MAFHDDRLPDDIERGFEAITDIEVDVASSDSGFERRNLKWQDFRREYELGYGIQRKVGGYDRLQDHFHARLGKTHSFPFKAWDDFDMPRQVIGQTDTSTTDYQMFKTYDSGGFTYDRNVTKPVSGTVRVWVDNVEIFEGAGGSEFTVDLLTGIITIGATLAAQNATDVEAECEYNVPVRYDSPLRNILQLEDAGSVAGVRLVEVFGE